MILKSLMMALGASLLIAAGEPPAPPPELESYIEDGQLQPGDYAWAKGRFDDASNEEKAAFHTIAVWSSRCIEDAKAEAKEQLRALGFDTALESTMLGPLLCRQVLFFPNIPAGTTFAAFREETKTATPIADSYLFAVRQAEESIAGSADLAEALRTRPLGEQMLRRAISWGEGMAAGAPELTPMGREIVRSRLWAATAVRDDANTRWLKDIVAKDGWPRISAVGERSANEAWLLVQHADHDPLFQLEALRLMEPLVAEKEVSPRNYAYLYDRVMLKLAGKQRYGTQFTCMDGKWAPLSLEDASAVDRFRQEVGMETQAEATARIAASYGKCN
jgi:hypothetical protein